MSMHSYVEGFIPADAKFQKMFDAYKACEKAGVPIPKELDKYFNGELPDPAGVKIVLTRHAAVKRHTEETEDGFEVDLTKLPKDIRIIRFVNSY